MAAGFWDHFFDNDHRQREDINELREQLARSSDTAAWASATGTLQRKVRDLETLVSVLVKMLEEAGQVDAKVLRYRVEAELDALMAARQAAGVMSMSEALHGAPGASAEPVEAPPPTTPTVCARCGATVPQNRTTITENGVICDACAVRAGKP